MKIEELHQLFLNSKGVTTDSRKIESGQLFFALKGDNFNGNKFAKNAIEQGASFVVIDEAEFAVGEKFLLVDDVLNTLQELAKFHREYLKIPVLAITGTNGKTTTKELISAVLKRKYNPTNPKKILAPQGPSHGLIFPMEARRMPFIKRM